MKNTLLLGIVIIIFIFFIIYIVRRKLINNKPIIEPSQIYNNEQPIENPKEQKIENPKEQKIENPKEQKIENPKEQKIENPRENTREQQFVQINFGEDLMMRFFQPINIIQTKPKPNQIIPEKTPDQSTDEYFNTLVKHEDNPQNVHNTEINKILKKKYDRIIELNDIKLSTLDEDVVRDIRNQTQKEIMENVIKYLDYQKDSDKNIQKSKTKKMKQKNYHLEKKKVEMLLEKIAQGNLITSFSSEPIREDDILTNVWMRIHADDNKENQQSLKISLYDQLFDSVVKKSNTIHVMEEMFSNHLQRSNNPIADKYNPVCINGRTSRVLSCFTLLDNDLILSQPEKDYNEIANEAYQKTSHLVNQAYLDHPEMQNDNDLESDANKKFEIYIKDLVSETLTKEYKDLLSDKKLETLIKSAQAGI
jgi:hypothetical protein